MVGTCVNNTTLVLMTISGREVHINNTVLVLDTCVIVQLEFAPKRYMDMHFPTRCKYILSFSLSFPSTVHTVLYGRQLD